MQFWVYILRCRDGSYYTGHTDHLEKRLAEHQQGLAADWTRRRRLVELVWCALGSSRDEVFAFERRVKNWSRAKKEALIAGDWALVGQLARPPHERPSTQFIESDAAGGVEGLGTNENAALLEQESIAQIPLVSSEVVGRGTELDKET